MRNLTVTICLTLAVLFGSMGMSESADSQKGMTAYKSGDYATALRKWKPLAEQGNARAQFLLGWMHHKGEGVPQNDKIAVKWYRLAAKQGYADAQWNLGSKYALGEGVLQNHKTAVKWYRLAAEQGNAFAQSHLGLCYLEGAGVLKDYVYAHMWGNLGASNGNVHGGYVREIAAKNMTPADLSTAQKLARECVRKKYKGC